MLMGILAGPTPFQEGQWWFGVIPGERQMELYFYDNGGVRLD